MFPYGCSRQGIGICVLASLQTIPWCMVSVRVCVCVCVITAVDKAVLDLVPYPLKDLLASLGFENGARLSGSASPRYVAPGVVSLVFETLLRRLKIDPWIYADTTILTERKSLTPPCMLCWYCYA